MQIVLIALIKSIKIIKSQNGLKKDVNCKYKVIINKVDKTSTELPFGFADH